jgi:hypothetical protein
VVYEKLAVQVISLMLHACAVIALTLNMHRVAVQVEAVQCNAAGPLHFGTQIRNRKTAFVFFVGLGIKNCDDGIDEHAEILGNVLLFFFQRYVNDNDAFQDADLRRGYAYATDTGKRIQHVGSESPDFFVYFINRLAFLGKERVRILQDGA